MGLTPVSHSPQHAGLLLPSSPFILYTCFSTDGENGQPIADAYQTVQNVVGNAMNVVFQLSSWFTDYETAPYTNIGGVGQNGVEERVYPARKWVCAKKISRAGDSDAKSGMFWSLFKYIQGANSGEVKIDMTTPVTTMVEEDTDTDNLVYEMCFYIGAAHQSNPPTPSNTRVYIKEEEERKIFTRKVGGWMDSEKWAREAEELKVVLAKKRLQFLKRESLPSWL